MIRMTFENSFASLREAVDPGRTDSLLGSGSVKPVYPRFIQE
jgi:hypothetical protein